MRRASRSVCAGDPFIEMRYLEQLPRRARGEDACTSSSQSRWNSRYALHWLRAERCCVVLQCTVRNTLYMCFAAIFVLCARQDLYCAMCVIM